MSDNDDQHKEGSGSTFCSQEANNNSPTDLPTSPWEPQKLQMAKKAKKDKKKSKKKQQLTPEEEKDLLVSVLATKCNMKKEDVEEAYDDFYLKYKEGFIEREEYIQSMKVNEAFNTNMYNLRHSEHDDGGVLVPGVWRGQEWDPQLWRVSPGHSGGGPWHGRGQTFLDLHGIWCWWRRINRQRRNIRHLRGTVPTGRYRGGPGPPGLLRLWCEVRLPAGQPVCTWSVLFRATIDFDGDGDISKEEFVQNATQSKFIADLLTKTQYND